MQGKIELTLFILTLTLISSCIPMLTPHPQSSGRARSNANTPLSVLPGYGRILADNPIILSNYNWSLPPNVDLGLFLKSDQTFITDGSTLTGSCSSVSSSVSGCYKVYNDDLSSPLAPVQGRWAFPPNSKEFLQVHTFGHIKKEVDRFQSALSFIYSKANPLPNVYTGGGNYPTSIPSSLYTNYGYWNKQNTLNAYSDCLMYNNAYFSPSTFSLCFGEDPNYAGLFWAQDPTIIYHELGHALTHIMLNMRNNVVDPTTLGPQPQVDLGGGDGASAYSEARSISEGLADYFSYVITGRTHMGEWAAGRFYNQSRPITEADSAHSAGIDTTTNGRLSYPKYIGYTTYAPTEQHEDVHAVGMIASHFLVALTNDFKSFCGMDHVTATNNTLYIIAETLAELGDLTTLGSNFNPSNTVNMVTTNSLGDPVAATWINTAKNINFRTFFQSFAKHFLYISNNNGLCATQTYSQDRIEQLLDQYGLLLFRTYNEDGNNVATGHSGTHTSVNVYNRINTVLIPKSYLMLNPNPAKASAYIGDDRQQIYSMVSSLKASGIISTGLSDLIPSDLPYNNGRGTMSPGEIVAVILNLYNNSNSAMAGVEVLANNWDHAKLDNGVLKPCNTFDDTWPLASEGAAPLDSNPPIVGDCNYITKTNGGDNDGIGGHKEVMAPVCYVLYRDTNNTLWVNQDFYRQKIGLQDSNCLMGSKSPYECLVRAIPGADHAVYSKINPQSTWYETFTNPTSNQNESDTTTHSFNSAILFEVNPYTPPGTTFDCRFRVRFSNCDDCYHDSAKGNDDYLDYEFAGGKPFEIIHWQYTVTD